MLIGASPCGGMPFYILPKYLEDTALPESACVDRRLALSRTLYVPRSHQIQPRARLMKGIKVVHKKKCHDHQYRGVGTMTVG